MLFNHHPQTNGKPLLVIVEGADRVPALTPAQALPCLSTRTRLTVVFPTALLGSLLWVLPCLSTQTRLTVVFLTFSVLAQGGGVCKAACGVTS